MNTAPSAIHSIPQGLTGDTLIAAINDRLRRLTAASGGATAKVTTGSGGAVTQIAFTVPGTIGIDSTAAPLLSLPASQTPSSIIAVLTVASVGGAVAAQVTADGTPVGSVTIPDGTAAMTQVTGAALAQIPANALIALAVTGVGLTLPGKGLTVMVRF